LDFHLEVKKREAEVEAEVKNREAKAYLHAYRPSESPEEVSMSSFIKWVKARVGMLLAQVIEIPYTQEVYARGEFATLERDLSSLERKLFEEPDSRVKADIFEEIEKVRELLFLLGE